MSGPASRILEAALHAGARSLAIVGIAKNAGKTTTLNALLSECARRDIPIGMTSVGRDGEPVDVVTGERKPALRLARGTIAATSEGSLDPSDPVTWLADTGLSGPMGAIVLVRVEADARLEVAGPSEASGLARVLAQMEARGCALTLVDGAFDRRASASPALTDATVVAAGLSLAPDPDEVARETAHFVSILSMPATGGRVARAAARVVTRGRSAVLAGTGRLLVDLGESLLDREAAVTGAFERAGGRGPLAVAVGAAATDALLEALAAQARAVEVVVRDPTSAFVSPLALAKLRIAGGRISALRPVRVVAVTANPRGPGGVATDPGDFLARMRRALQPVPVHDVVWEADCRPCSYT